MKNNIKKLGLIIFFLNNSFKVFSNSTNKAQSKQKTPAIQQEKRQKQREEAQQNKLLYALGGIVLFSLLYFYKTKQQYLEDKFDFDDNNNIDINDNNHMDIKIKKYLYMLQTLIDKIYSHKDDINNFNTQYSTTIVDYELQQIIHNTALNDIDFCQLFKHKNILNSHNYDQKKTEKDNLLMDIQNKYLFFVHFSKSILQNESNLSEQLKLNIFNFFKDNEEKILFFIKNSKFVKFNIFDPSASQLLYTKNINKFILETFFALFSQKDFFIKLKNSTENLNIIKNYKIIGKNISYEPIIKEILKNQLTDI